MKNKLVQLAPIATVLMSLLLWRAADICTSSQVCVLRALAWSAFPQVVKPLYIYSIAIILPAVILIFVSDSVFRSWWKFARWALPLSIVLMALTPVDGGGFFVNPIVRENAAWVTGILFSGISLILIIWKSLAQKKIR